ncbi:MAG: Ig domain-containing protein [Synergistales bacterium]|nr:Ig domain-containing protein [Synergistales bacterium]MDY6401889.1 Ig domain-containing protein [Synergistales bacterium]MDY6403903.1 Ig domain-containing protein [Synergistales bacterium]MDY6411299.1 Ig domain-containing protein [Synergistales bacterium]MDY6414811.1 Ig domain-containing protein [Synergistales bacterium]
MKRFQWLILLCAFMLAFTSCAWAEESVDSLSVVKAPLRDHGASAEADHDEDVKPSDYNVELLSGDTHDGTKANPYVIKLTATALPAHYNGGHMYAYWIGVGIEHKDNATYDWGWNDAPENFGEKDNTSEFTEGEKTYYSFYWGTYTSLSDKKAYLVVKPSNNNSGENLIYYTLDFAGVTNKINVTGTAKLAPADAKLTYGQKLSELKLDSSDIKADLPQEANEANNGAVSKDFTDYHIEWENPETVPTVATSPAKYKVVFKPTSPDKYVSTWSCDLEVTVEKAEGTSVDGYAVPTDLTATVGQKLSDIKLPTGWSWVSGDTEITGTGEKTFKANFTPTDTTNYKVVENVDVTVTVTAKAASEPDEPATTEPELTLTVTPTTATLKEGKVGEVYSDDLKVRFKTETTPAGKTITWTAADLPADLKLDTATGIISGTPKEATPQGKPHEIKITVTATSGDKTKTAEVTATLTVTNTGSTTPTKPEDPDTETDKPAETDTKTDETKQTEQEKKVETAIDALSSDSTVELTKEQVSLIVNAIVEENSKVELTSEQVNNLMSNLLSGDTASSLSDTQVQTLVEKTVVSADGTLDSKVMETITSAIKTENENAMTAADITSGTSTAAKMVVTALTKSVEKSSGNELKLKDVPLTSMNGIATLLTKIADGISGVETKNITLDLSGMGSQLTKIDNLDGVDVKEMKLEDTAVTGVDLSKATIETVSMKNSKVTELKLGTDSNVTNINANGSKELSEVSIEGNKNIKTLDISGTNVSSLNAEECEKLETLTVEGGTNEGEGALQNLNLEGCKNLKELTVSNNKLLGVKKPDNMTNSNITFRARGQKRSSTDFKLSRRMNLWKFLWAVWQASLEADDVNKGEYKAESHDIAPFDVSKITSVTTDVGQVTPNASGDVEFTGTPSSFTYEYDPGFTTATPTGFMTAEEAQKSGMDVTIDASSDDGSSSISSSGGGCDAGFSFGALSALMLVFATLRKRR